MTDAQFEAGLAVRTEVLGQDYVQRSLAAGQAHGRDLQRLITSYCWGEVWGRAGLARRDRSLVTLGMLIALDRPQEIEVHVRGALNNGCSHEEILEVVLHSAIYCGVPAAISAQKAVERALQAAV